MVGSKYGEDALVEQPTMTLLAELGWDTLSGFDPSDNEQKVVGEASTFVFSSIFPMSRVGGDGLVCPWP